MKKNDPDQKRFELNHKNEIAPWSRVGIFWDI